MRAESYNSGMTQDELLEVVAANVKKYRDRKGLTQAAASELSGITHADWCRIERGKSVTLKTLVRIASALGVEPWQLLKPPTARKTS